MRFLCFTMIFFMSCVENHQAITDKSMSTYQAEIKNEEIGKLTPSTEKLIQEVSTSNELRDFSRKYHLELFDIHGKLLLTHEDDFTEQEYTLRVEVQNNHKKELIQVLNEESLTSLQGKEIKFTGIKLNNQNLGIIQPNIEESSDSRQAQEGIKKGLILLINFSDNVPPSDENGTKVPLTFENVAEYLNTGFYRKYFQELFQGDQSKLTDFVYVEDWYTIDSTCEENEKPNDPGKYGWVSRSKINQILQEREVDLSNIDHVSVISYCGAKNWLGYGEAYETNLLGFENIPVAMVTHGRKTLHFGKESDIQPGYSPISFMRHFIHERLHNFDINHSQGLDCGEREVLHPCSMVEYGNPFDVMGFGAYDTTLNVDAMRRAGIRNESFYQYINQPGVYYIDPILSQSTTAKIGLYIESEFVTESPVFLLEHRRVSSISQLLSLPEFEDVNGGLAIMSSILSSDHQTSPKFTGSGEGIFRTIDPKPQGLISGILNGDSPSYQDRVRYDALIAGDEYFDPITGIRINVLENDLVSLEPKVKVLISYDEQNRICFKESIEDQIANLWISKNGTSFPREDQERAASDTILNRGDDFQVRFSTRRLNPMYCPRENFLAEFLNPEVGNSLLEVPIDGGGSGGIGQDPPSFNNTRKALDDGQSYNFGHFTLRSDPPVGDHTLMVKFTNLRTNESIVRPVIIKIR